MKNWQRKTRSRVWGVVACSGIGMLLLAGTAAADPPFGGGLPQCLLKLHQCSEALDTRKADLAACQAEPNAVFPGDGAGHGAALRYTDNGDGTATDNNTMLMWEVKDNNGGVHDVDNRYTWSAGGTIVDGTLFTVFLDTLNNKCDGDETTTCTSKADCVAIGNGKCGHAGFRDWRIPHIKELQSIVDYGVASPGPLIDPTFPGLTIAQNYWSSTELAGNPSNAWIVIFDFGHVLNSPKTFPLWGRAVRGGR